MLASIEIISIPGFNDPVSCFTHLLGALIALVAGVQLVRHAAPNAATRLSLAAFSGSAVFLLSMSGVFHLLPDGPGRAVLQRLDHAAIFTLIAGTFTPVHAILFKGVGRWGMLAFIWTFAIVGITLKTIFFEDIPYWFGLLLYLGMGWMGAVSMVMSWRTYGFRSIRHLLWGAAAYTVGAIIELVGQPVLIPGVLEAHEIFHVFVLLGLIEHWRFVYQCAHRETVGWTVR